GIYSVELETHGSDERRERRPEKIMPRRLAHLGVHGHEIDEPRAADPDDERRRSADHPGPDRSQSHGISEALPVAGAHRLADERFRGKGEPVDQNAATSKKCMRTVLAARTMSPALAPRAVNHAKAKTRHTVRIIMSRLIASVRHSFALSLRRCQSIA